MRIFRCSNCGSIRLFLDVDFHLRVEQCIQVIMATEAQLNHPTRCWGRMIDITDQFKEAIK